MLTIILLFLWLLGLFGLDLVVVLWGMLANAWSPEIGELCLPHPVCCVLCGLYGPHGKPCTIKDES